MSDLNNGRAVYVTYGSYQGERVAYVPLTKGRQAIVSVEDWTRVAAEYGERWLYNGNGKGRHYAKKSITVDGQKRLRTLSAAVMEAAPGRRVEVLNGDGLDCRRVNLRLKSYKESNGDRREYATGSREPTAKQRRPFRLSKRGEA